MASAADQTATFAINLEDGTSGPAESAAKALQNLKNQITADTKALREMQAAMKNLKGAVTPNVQQMKELQDQIAAKKGAIAEAQSAFISLGGSFKATASGGKPIGNLFKQLEAQAARMPGPLSGMAAQLGSIRAMLAGGAMALGVVALVAAFVALAAGLVLATGALLKYGVAQANAARAELLQLEALTKMRTMWKLAAGNAKEMQTAIDQVAAKVPLAREKVAQMNTELYKMGLRGENLTLALEGTAIATAGLSDEAGKSFAQMAAGASLAGKSVRRLSDDVKARFGGIVAAQMLDLNVQSAKLRENFAALFGGLNIEGLLNALNGVTSLFSQATRSGQALKAIFTALFQPLIGAIEYMGPLVKRFFQGIIIGALLVTIAILKLRNWFRQTFADSATLKGMDLQTLALKAGLLAVSMLAAGVAILMSPLLVLVGIIAGLIAGLDMISKVAKSVVLTISSIDWTALGKSMVQGIIDGVASMAGFLTDQFASLAVDALGTFKKVLGIASPSKEFAKLGLAIPEGIAEGVSAGAGDVDSAMGDVTPAATGAGRGGAGGPVTLTFGDIYVGAGAGDKPQQLAADFVTELRTILESVSIQLGAPV